MEPEDGEAESESEVAELRLKAESLKQELKECRAELSKLHKQLSQTERLRRSTESYNEDLRKQVSAEPCCRKNTHCTLSIFCFSSFIFYQSNASQPVYSVAKLSPTFQSRKLEDWDVEHVLVHS
ncbi:unnamed protein product [Ophioblennius macclurei]